MIIDNIGGETGEEETQLSWRGRRGKEREKCLNKSHKNYTYINMTVLVIPLHILIKC
jgi:hypothetical protein